jgi:hypothetical protein
MIEADRSASIRANARASGEGRKDDSGCALALRAAYASLRRSAPLRGWSNSANRIRREFEPLLDTSA